MPFLKAVDAGVKFIVSPVERIPVQDVIEMVHYAIKNDVKLLGPGSLGLISPGKAAIGWLGGQSGLGPDPVQSRSRWGYFPQRAGSPVPYPGPLRWRGWASVPPCTSALSRFWGLTMADVLKMYETDEQTKAVAIFGEIGGTLEEEAAETVARGEFTKPLVVFIAGAWGPGGDAILPCQQYC